MSPFVPVDPEEHPEHCQCPPCRLVKSTHLVDALFPLVSKEQAEEFRRTQLEDGEEVDGEVVDPDARPRGATVAWDLGASWEEHLRGSTGSHTIIAKLTQAWRDSAGAEDVEAVDAAIAVLRRKLA